MSPTLLLRKFIKITAQLVTAHKMTNIPSIYQIVQWYQNDSRVIGVYKPNYEDVEFVRKEGRLTDWKREDIRWKTPDGKQPKDFVNDRKCSILSKFATVLNLNCEEAITVAFVIGFGALFILLLIVFMVFKRRQVNNQSNQVLRLEIEIRNNHENPQN